MRHLIFTLLFIAVSAVASAQFSRYFQDKTLRMDYYHAGDAKNDSFFFKELIEEPYWGGSKVSLIDPKGYGTQQLRVYDAATDSLLYSTSYSTLFDEWQSTAEARQTRKAYPESVVMPFPRIPVRIEIWSRDRNNVFHKSFEYNVNPDSYFIRRGEQSYENWDVVYNGAPAHMVDIVLIAEGYSENDKEQFRRDADRFARELLGFSPYKELAAKFNIRAVWSPSAQSGVTVPAEHAWKKSKLGASFYTFDSERYLMVDDFQRVRDVAASVPYDNIYILANTKKYGGGGIYNFYGISASGHPEFTGNVYVHEFGHLFAALGDEYVGTTSFDDMFPKDVEPMEENLTTLVNFQSKFWSKMLPKSTKIPTVEASQGAIGVYEGGGYQSKGIYRPWPNCTMRTTKSNNGFCPVCTEAIRRRVAFVTK